MSVKPQIGGDILFDLQPDSASDDESVLPIEEEDQPKNTENV